MAHSPPGFSTRSRWGAAKTNRLNSAHWEGANSIGTSINQDIAEDGPTLRTRCRYEIAQNPIVEGMIETYCLDLVGNGPTLNVGSDNDDYNTSLEQIRKEWWESPDINRQMSGAEMLELGIRNCWSTGEFLWQIADDPDRRGPVKFSLHDILSTRLDTPMAGAGDPNIMMGIEIARPERPVAYYIQEVDQFGDYAYTTGQSERVPAEYMIHWFRRIESGQIRGVPWLAVALEAIADLRDYDAEVLDAARAAADTGIYWHTNHPDARYIEVNESTKMERRTQATGPPGWTPMQVNPQQPSTRYVEFRHERLGDIGRPVNMPLMIVRLDSQRHNYSSARFDGQRYQRGLERTQDRLCRPIGRIDMRIAREAELAGELRPAPRRVELTYAGWPRAPHVDPGKEAKAWDMKLANLTTDLSDALVADGTNLDAHMIKLKRTDKLLQEAIGIGLIEYIQLIGKTKRELDEDEEEDGNQSPTQKAQSPSANGNGRGRFELAN